MDLWTSPTDRREPCGPCGQPVDNADALPTALPTLSRLSPTSSTGPTTGDSHTTTPHNPSPRLPPPTVQDNICLPLKPIPTSPTAWLTPNPSGSFPYGIRLEPMTLFSELEVANVLMVLAVAFVVVWFSFRQLWAAFRDLFNGVMELPRLIARTIIDALRHLRSRWCADGSPSTRAVRVRRSHRDFVFHSYDRARA